MANISDENLSLSVVSATETELVFKLVWEPVQPEKSETATAEKIRNFSIQLSKRDLPLQSMLEACNGSRMQVLLCAVIILVLRNCL